jgi:hypothetical protein
MSKKHKTQKLSISEVRAEACTVTLRLWLAQLPGKDASALKSAALAETKNIGYPGLREEVEWLFDNHALEG